MTDVTAANSPDDGGTHDEDDPVEGELIPESVQAEITRRVVMELEQYSSPHPHPEHLERYAALYPEAPKIVFDAFRDQGNHRREMERTYMAGSERRANIGQWLAFLLVLAVIVAGVIAILRGYATAGATVIAVGFGGGILLVIAGAKQPPRDAARRPRTNQRGRTTARGEVAQRTSPPSTNEPEQ